MQCLGASRFEVHSHHASFFDRPLKHFLNLMKANGFQQCQMIWQGFRQLKHTAASTIPEKDLSLQTAYQDTIGHGIKDGIAVMLHLHLSIFQTFIHALEIRFGMGSLNPIGLAKPPPQQRNHCSSQNDGKDNIHSLINTGYPAGSINR